MVAVAGVTVCHAAQNAGGGLEKRRVVASGRLTGTNELSRVVTWQTYNASSLSAKRAKAHLAVETTGRNPRIIWQTDGGDAYYKTDSVRVADLDGDGLPEIIGLWRENPSSGSLRVFHWDRAEQRFVEVSDGSLRNIRSYQISGGRSAKGSLRLAAFPSALPSVRREYELRGSELKLVGGRPGEVSMQETTKTDSGIEGITEIKLSHPVTRENAPDPEARPFSTELAVYTAGERREVARLKTGSDGRFRVSLPPGDYIIAPVVRQKIGSPRALEHVARVSPGKFIFVRIAFDSGLQ